MFILSCNGTLTNVYEANQVSAMAHNLSVENDAPVSVIQHERYIGDWVEVDHYIHTIFPPSKLIH